MSCLNKEDMISRDMLKARHFSKVIFKDRYIPINYPALKAISL